MRTAADVADPTTDGRAHDHVKGRVRSMLAQFERLPAEITGNGVWPGATYRPVCPQKTNGPWNELLGVAIHVNVSNGNLTNWVGSPSVEMSCHFEFYKDGTVEQYLPITTTSWCQSDGNGYYISFETEGYPSEPFTDAQQASIAACYAWIHTVTGIPLQLAEVPNVDAGLIWHGAGGDAWGGHPDCPGDLRKAERAAILAAAGEILNPTKDWLDMATKDEVTAAVTQVVAAYEGLPQFVQFVRVGPGGNAAAVYAVRDGELEWQGPADWAYTKNRLGGLPPNVSQLDSKSGFWNWPVMGGDVNDYRGKVKPVTLAPPKPATVTEWLANARKFITAVVGGALAVVSYGLLPDSVNQWVTLIVGVLTALGLYVVPNTPPAIDVEPSYVSDSVHGDTTAGDLPVVDVEPIAPLDGPGY